MYVCMAGKGIAGKGRRPGPYPDMTSNTPTPYVIKWKERIVLVSASLLISQQSFTLVLSQYCEIDLHPTNVESDTTPLKSKAAAQRDEDRGGRRRWSPFVTNKTTSSLPRRIPETRHVRGAQWR